MVMITENRSFKYFLYTSIYLVEGVASLLMFTILPIYLKNYKGFSDLSIAFTAGVSLLPVIFKPLVAILSDSYNIKILGGRRRPYILIGFILNSVTLFLFGITDPLEFIYLFTIIWLFQSLGIALMDVSLDALVIESFESSDEKINANIAFHIAMISSIFILFPIAYISERYSIHLGVHLTPQLGFDVFYGGNFEFGFILAGIVCIGLIIFTLFLQEGEQIQTKSKFSKNALKNFIKSKNIPTLFLMFFLLQIDTGLIDFTLDPFFRLLGLTSGVQLLSFSPMVIVAAIGGLSSKWIAKKGIIIPITICSIIFAAHNVILTTLTLIKSSFIPLYYYGAGIIISFFSNCTFVLYLTIAMNSADREIAATSLVLLLTMNNLGRIFGIVLAGFLPFSDYLKMGVIFIISAIIMIGRIPVFLKLKELDNINIEQH